MRQGRQPPPAPPKGGGNVDKEEERRTIQTHEDLIIYQKAFQAAMTIFELSKQFPDVERYSLTDQIRRSSRSVCANLAEEPGGKEDIKPHF